MSSHRRHSSPDPGVASVRTGARPTSPGAAGRGGLDSWLRAFYRESPVAIGFSRDGITVGANPAYVRMFGYDSEDEIVGRSLLEQIAPSARADISTKIQERKRGGNGSPAQYETRGLRKDGSEFPFQIHVARVALSGGPVTAVTIQDISDRVRSAEALQEAVRLSRQVILSAHEGIIVYGPDRRYQVWNPFMERLSGVPAAEALGKLPRELFPFLGDVGVLDRIERALAGEVPPPLEFPFPGEGRPRWFLDTSAPLRNEAGTVIGVIATVQETTERHRSAAALRDNERRLRTLFENAGDYLLTLEVRPDGPPVVRDANAAAAQAFGYSRDEMRGQPVTRFETEESAADASRRGRELARKGAALFEVCHQRKDGTTFDAEVLASMAPHGDEQLVIAVERDITERKRMERALRLSEERYRMVFENSGTANSIFDLDCRLVMQNSLSSERLGMSRDQAQGKSAFELFGPTAGAAVEERMRRVMSSRRPETFETEFELHDGTRWFRSSYQPIFDDLQEVRGVQIVSQEITARKRLEEEREKLRTELFHAQKMEAIGTLAGGVAHDFNNILGGVLGGLSLLEIGLGPGSEHQGEIREMKALVMRGADLAKQLLGVGRRGKYDVKPIDLAAAVRQIGTMFGRTRRDITIQFELDADVDALLMDHAQLEQTLLNLFFNAGQAMPQGGQVRVLASNETLSPEQAARHELAPGRFVRLVVADTGVGMDEATQQRIFEPFFTTKEPGQGTGLGLASVYGIVRNHGGAIAVDSAPGRGAAFTLYLPVADRPVEAAAPEQEAPPVSRSEETRTILVVDDEARLRDVLSQLLELLGYQVLTAAGGREAVELVRVHGARISLVLLDLTMPDMGGAKTFDALREIEPDLKVLLASGFAVDGQAQELLARGCNGFIQKPFDIDALAAKLESLL